MTMIPMTVTDNVGFGRKAAQHNSEVVALVR